MIKLALRWYGKDFDTTSLKDIRQTCYAKGVISSLMQKLPGEVWTEEEIRNLKKEVEDSGLEFLGIESINISDNIKAGTKDRDKDIEAYIKSLENAGKAGVHLICYNFMPVFDWTRTELNKQREDGSYVLAYDQDIIDKITPEEMFDRVKTDEAVLPGWEPERMAKIKELFELYKNVTEEDLMNNLKYFLEKIMPTCDKYNIDMAIHPDDPCFSVFGLPRIISSEKNLKRIIDMVPNKHNGVTFCIGSFATNKNNDCISTIKTLKGRIPFAHIRNIKLEKDGRYFEETAHLSEDGDLDIYEILKALKENGFDGVIRPDHGRMLFGEEARPGYGFYDRVLGIAYIAGLLEAIEKNKK